MKQIIWLLSLLLTIQFVAAQTQITSGNLETLSDMQLNEKASTPSVPTNSASIFASLFAGRPMFGQVSDTGHRYFYQPLMGIGNVCMTSWGFNSASNANIGGGSITFEDADDAAAALSMGTTIFAQHKRIRATSSAATNSPAGVRSIGAMAFLGNNPGEGGFFLIYQFGIATAQTGARGMVGLREIADIPNTVTVTGATDVIAFMFDDNQTTWRVISNDATGNSVQHADLGPNFPTNTSSDGWMTFALYAPSGQASYVYWYAKRVTNAGTVYETSGKITSDLPTAETLMNWHMWINTGISTSAVAFDMGSVYLETEN
jgi:hypothetical protein